MVHNATQVEQRVRSFLSGGSKDVVDKHAMIAAHLGEGTHICIRGADPKHPLYDFYQPSIARRVVGLLIHDAGIVSFQALACPLGRPTVFTVCLCAKLSRSG